jgi:hypothetical protein
MLNSFLCPTILRHTQLLVSDRLQLQQANIHCNSVCSCAANAVAEAHLLLHMAANRLPLRIPKGAYRSNRVDPACEALAADSGPQGL